MILSLLKVLDGSLNQGDSSLKQNKKVSLFFLKSAV
jgi:hypothetical protein